jgi:hypothetical protein
MPSKQVSEISMGQLRMQNALPAGYLHINTVLLTDNASVVSHPREYENVYRLCGLVVRVSGYRSRDPGFNSQRYQISWEVLGLERGPLSLVRITEELLEWKSSGSGSRKIDINGRGNPLCWPRDTLYPRKLELTSPSGGRSVGIVLFRTKATEFRLVFSSTCKLRTKHPWGYVIPWPYGIATCSSADVTIWRCRALTRQRMLHMKLLSSPVLLSFLECVLTKDTQPDKKTFTFI